MATAEDFKGWLKKGLGRAVIYLRDHDGGPHREALLNACIYNVAFDAQTERSREKYLKDLIRASGHQGFIRNGLIHALSADEIEAKHVDLDQIVAVARLFADDGDDAVKSAMYDAVRRAGFERAGECYADLIAVDGLEALKIASEDFPETMDDFNLWTVDELLAALEARDGAAEAHRAIYGVLDQSAKLSVVVDRIGKAQERSAFTDETDGWDYKTLNSKVQSSTRLQQLSRWGQSASVEDLKAASDDLNAESNRTRLLSYLTIFRKAAFPGPIGRLLELAESEDNRLAWGAVQILANMSDARIRNVLLRMLADWDSCGRAVELMIGNYCQGDFFLIEQLLETSRDTEILHSIGMGVRHLVKRHCSPESVGCLMFLYENGPCALCRGEFVEHLLTLNALPAWMREECMFDSDLCTRKLVQT